MLSAPAAPPRRYVLDGVMDQYDAITEADRRWGHPQCRGIAYMVGATFVVGLHDDRTNTREVWGSGHSYESAFRDAEKNGHVADGSFSDKPSRHPLYRDM